MSPPKKSGIWRWTCRSLPNPPPATQPSALQSKIRKSTSASSRKPKRSSKNSLPSADLSVVPHEEFRVNSDNSTSQLEDLNLPVNGTPSSVVFSLRRRDLRQYFRGKVISVYDGDTVTVLLELPPPYERAEWYLECDETSASSVSRRQKVKLCMEEAVRLNGIDAPEVKPKITEPLVISETEKRAGLLVRDVLTQRILERNCEIHLTHDNDKFGRLLADLVLLDDSSSRPGVTQSVSNWLLEKQLVKRYNGRQTKAPWTLQELNDIISRAEYQLTLVAKSNECTGEDVK